MAHTFQAQRKTSFRTKALIKFRTACKYDADYARIEGMLWQEHWRRNRGISYFPDKEYYREICNLYYSTGRDVGEIMATRTDEQYQNELEQQMVEYQRNVTEQEIRKLERANV